MEQPIRVLTAGGVEDWTLEVYDAPDYDALTLRSPGSAEWTAAGADLFDALLGLRRQVEPAGIRLCCNGSRRDVWPSQLLRAMSDGGSAYVLRKGRRPTSRHLVEILAPADCALVVSIEEQRAYVEKWWRSATTWRLPLYALSRPFRPYR